MKAKSALLQSQVRESQTGFLLGSLRLERLISLPPRPLLLLLFPRKTRKGGAEPSTVQFIVPTSAKFTVEKCCSSPGGGRAEAGQSP
jgi:hypothetical protein